MHRLNKGVTLAAFIAALTAAAMTAGCSSGAPASSAGAATASSTAASSQSAGYKNTQAIRKCLKTYGISRAKLKATYKGTATGSAALSQATLEQAGQQCWKSDATGLAASALRRIDHCLGLEGAATTHGGSPLSDVLLSLESHSTKTRNALKFCLRT